MCAVLLLLLGEEERREERRRISSTRSGGSGCFCGGLRVEVLEIEGLVVLAGV